MPERADGGAVEIEVGHTWDGEPLPAAQRAHVRLLLGAQELALTVAAPFHGDPPPPGKPGATPALWEHEVVELFLVADAPGPPTYTEIELSPWGHHLVLQLHGVRRVVASGLPLEFRSRRSGDRWVGAARLPLELLPPAPWRANAFAIHGPKEARRYLAATPLPGPAPDFHQPERFPRLASPLRPAT